MSAERTATFLRSLDGFTGDARLYQLSTPVEYESRTDDGQATTSFVIVSATVVMFSGPETHIFPANANGEVVAWGELDGSYKGGLDHEAALAGAGYSIATAKAGEL